MNEQRPDPDVLLARVQEQEAKELRGKLKIFFGAAPGVGKTYAMLEAARKQAKAGIDVLIGYVEPHVRPETLALTLGLDVLARREITYRGRTLFEFDLDAAIARKPQLIIVDELAHTNVIEPDVPRHAKRWRDVVQLLDAGIDVYTTLNVQHLESLNDIVAQITGVIVRETVPDLIFDEADEVELVDLPPDDLVERLTEGKVYVAAQAGLAIENFFRKGNLIALRELALRRTAERVNAQMQDYREENAVHATWPTAERLLVCVGPSPFSARLVRATRRIAASLRAPWIAVHVETPANRRLSSEDRDRLALNLHLAEQLGAETTSLSGERAVDEIIEFAHSRNVTKIIVGKPLESRFVEIFRGSFVYDLTKKCRDIDVYVISGEGDANGKSAPRYRSQSDQPQALKGYMWATAVVFLCTAIGWIMFPYFAQPNLIMVYLLGQILVSMKLGRGPSILASTLSVAMFDFCFVTPYHSFAVSDTQYLVTFAIMLVTGLVISTLTVRNKLQAETARQRERRTSALYAMSRELSAVRSRDDIVTIAIRHMSNVFDADVLILLPDEHSTLQAIGPAGADLVEHDKGVAEWVHRHGEIAGPGTSNLPGSKSIYVPLTTSDGTIGVVALLPHAQTRFVEPERLHLIEAFASHAALAIERANLAYAAQKALLSAETEHLRNSLLSAVSHDLRTPLATIIGATSALLDTETTVSEESRRELCESAHEEAQRLSRLVGNLLDMTRLDAGALVVKKEWQPLDEVIGVAIQRLGRSFGNRPLRIDLPTDLPPVPLDDLLIEQVLVNLLENALKYTPADSLVELSARRSQGQVTVEVADRGPGLPKGEEMKIFDKFYRIDQASSGRGVGLGLAICRGIVELHGGKIVAENRRDGGVAFRFTLPLEGMPPVVPAATDSTGGEAMGTVAEPELGAR